MFSQQADYVFFRKILAQNKTLYQLLGLTNAATAAQIKTNYFRLAKEHHPDKWSGDLVDLRNRVEQAKAKGGPDPLNATEQKKYNDALDLFKEISAAYETLSDPTKKAEYDRFLRDNAQPAAAPPQPAAAPRQPAAAPRQSAAAPRQSAAAPPQPAATPRVQVKPPHLLGILSQIINSDSWAEQKEFLIFFKTSQMPEAIDRYKAEFKAAANTPAEIRWSKMQNIAESELKNQNSKTSNRLQRLHHAIKDSNYDALQALLAECEKKQEKAPALPPGIKTIAFWKQQFASAGMSSVSLYDGTVPLEHMSDKGITNNPSQFYLELLNYAAHHGKKDIMELAFAAMQAVAPNLNFNMHFVFCEAARSGDVATIQSALNFFDLKNQAFNPNDEDFLGWAPWHCVARSGNVEAIRFIAGLPGINLSQQTGGPRGGEKNIPGFKPKYEYKSAVDYAEQSGNQEAVYLVRNLMSKYADSQPERKEERPSSSRKYF